MKLHRFISDFPIHESALVITDPEIKHQIERVLALKKGEEIVLGDGKGNEAVAIIEAFEKTGVRVQVLAWHKNTNESHKIVTLYLSILKRENFELAVQKATEVGVTRVVPVISSRTIKLAFRADRVKKIMKEASEQSGRGIVPELLPPVNFAEAVNAASTGERNLFFDKSGLPLTSVPMNSAHANIFIGPEGGWDDDEVAFARGRGCHIVSLGPLTLRGETAAIVASYLASQYDAPHGG